ncbi:hypothetical protein ACLOJK_007144, partial [Asimina triloba]
IGSLAFSNGKNADRRPCIACGLRRSWSYLVVADVLDGLDRSMECSLVMPVLWSRERTLLASMAWGRIDGRMMPSEKRLVASMLLSVL